MAIENSNNEEIPTYSEAHYEELASEEEIYLEKTEEDLRAALLSLAPGYRTSLGQPGTYPFGLIVGLSDR